MNQHSFDWAFMILFIDEDDCRPNNPCANGGSCTDGVNTFTCNCATGYTGATCATSKSSRKHLRTKVTPDFHLTYSKIGEIWG